MRCQITKWRTAEFVDMGSVLDFVTFVLCIPPLRMQKPVQVADAGDFQIFGNPHGRHSCLRSRTQRNTHFLWIARPWFPKLSQTLSGLERQAAFTVVELAQTRVAGAARTADHLGSDALARFTASATAPQPVFPANRLVSMGSPV